MRAGRLFVLLGCIIASLLPQAGFSAVQPLARTIIALHPPLPDDDLRGTMIHTKLEMPLNHLGLTVEYHSVDKPLPDIANRPDVRGVITWFDTEYEIRAPEQYIAWIDKVTAAGKRLVILGGTGIYPNENNFTEVSARINALLAHIGLQSSGSWNAAPYDAAYQYDEGAGLVMKRAYFLHTHPSYEMITSVEPANTLHLKAVDANGQESALIVTGPRGGYGATNYLYHAPDRDGQGRVQWSINMLEFLRRAFATDDLPKPDTTTLAGRRIYYSHIDGDGWNNVSDVDEYARKGVLSAQVIMEKAVAAYPDLPVTLTLIAADIDPQWAGTPKSREVAQKFLALPQVEAGTHSYSHPFDWKFFRDGNWRSELPYLSRYHFGHWDPSLAKQQPEEKSAAVSSKLAQEYDIPRAFATKPFDLSLEVEGSVKEISTLLPKGKKLELLTWSGDCAPWEEAVAMTRKAGLLNINGGDSRFDAEYPSYASLAPIGKQVGSERQIYASMSNENTYTDLWTRNYHGYAALTETLRNSETPVRLKPINIYYHLYSGEKPASLNALISNIEYARSQQITPIKTSDYIKIADGFYDTQITPERGGWRISNRGALQTIRFDRHSQQEVDFAKSSGVIGQRHYQGSLYVYLDEAIKSPLIVLKPVEAAMSGLAPAVAYLVESRWRVRELKQTANGFRFTAEGFGAGEMTWIVPPGVYRVKTGDTVKKLRSEGNVLTLRIERNALSPVSISIERENRA